MILAFFSKYAIALLLAALAVASGIAGVQTVRLAWLQSSIAKAMFAAATVLEHHIRWGADWDEDGTHRERGETDSPHFELV